MEDLRKESSLKKRLEIIGKMNLRKGMPIEIAVNYSDHKKKNDHRVIGYFQELRNVDLCLLGSARYPYLIYCGKKSDKKYSEEESICVDHLMEIRNLKYKNSKLE